MKTKISIIVALIIASFQLASAGIIIPGDSIGGGIVVGPVDDVTKVYIHEQQALQIAKEWYGNRTDVDYYIGASELIDNDYESNASELPDSSAWVRTGHHWLIVVDEHPNQNWSHECGYVYVQCERSRLTATRSCRVPGRMLPNGVNLRLTNSRNLYGNNASLKPTVAQSVPNYNTEVAGKTFALIINSASSRHDNLERYWNDCSFIYKVLTNKYNVMTDNIRILMPTDSLMRRADGSGYTSLPRNIGTDIWNLNINTLYDCLDEIKIEMNGTGHLLVFITGNAGTDDSGEPYIMLQGGRRMTAGELERMISSANVRVTDYVLGVSNASAFSEYLSGKGHVITAATGADEAATSCADKPFSEFLMHWTAAMCGSDALGNSVESDSDDNGRMTLEEAFAYADSLTTSTSGDISTVNRYLKEDVAFNNIPEGVDLYIRDNLDDTGKEPNCSNTFWNSPDIWLRNQDDGLENQEDEALELSTDNRFNHVYAYVRIWNRGLSDYNSSDKYLHIYWANVMMSRNGLLFMGKRRATIKNIYSNEEYPDIIDSAIKSDSCIILSYEISVPRKMVELYNNKRAYFNIVARISDSENMGFSDPIEETYDALIAVRESNNIAQHSKTKYLARNSNNTFTYIDADSTNYRYEFLTSDEALANVEMSIELSPTSYQAWKNAGECANNVVVYSSNVRKFYFMDSTSYISNIYAANQDDSIRVDCRFKSNASIVEPHKYNIHLVKKDISTNEIITGTTIEISSNGLSPLSPMVSSSHDNGIYNLTATNVNCEATYQWSDENCNVIGNQQHVEIDGTKATGTYELRVESNDGVVGYTYFNLDKIPLIESVSPNQFSDLLNIKLSRPANINTEIIVQGITNQYRKVFPMLAGENSINIYGIDCPNGNYVISVAENGEIKDSKQIIK